MSGNKRKKSTAGAAIEDDLPDHLHYHGNAPKQNKEFPGVFSTPVIPFISRQWNYSHWIYRADDDNHCCLKRRVANDKFCCLKIDDIFKFFLVPGALDEYEDDDEDFGDDEEED